MLEAPAGRLLADDRVRCINGISVHLRYERQRGGTCAGRAGAGGKDVALGGGANLARQYLIAGLVDEMEISLVPTLLGFGERLFDGVGDDLHALALVITCAGEYRGRRTSMTRRRTLSTSRSRRLHFDV